MTSKSLTPPANESQEKTPEKPGQSGDSPVVIRPNQRVFVGRPIIRAGLLYGTLAVAAHFFLPLFLAALDIGIWSWLGLALLVTTVKAVKRLVAYRKTFYEFYNDRLVVKTGTIATASTVDLPYRNVTQVIVRLPFLEYRLFSTGHLTVQTAGSLQGTANLQSVDVPKKLYERLADHLRENGFSLARTKMVQREKPHVVGTFLDTSGVALGGLVALLTVGFSVGSSVIDVMALKNFFELWDVLAGTIDPETTADVEEAQFGYRATLGLAILAILGGLFGIIKLVLHFIDLNRRTYTLWEDVVDYQDGFLTETRKFIPIENLADTAITEPFLKRLLGIANVVLSPHGSATQGIAFPSMPRAARFRDNLDRLIESTEGFTEIEAEEEENHSAGVGTDLSLAGAETRLPEVKGPPLEFRPFFLRTSIDVFQKAIGIALLMAIVGTSIHYTSEFFGITPEDFDVSAEELPTEWIFIGAGAIIAAFLVLNLTRTAFFCFTKTFYVGSRKISWVHDFISRDEIEFTTDKITTMEVERTLVDRLMGTATFVFHSIGNNPPIAFEDIRKSRQREEEIRRRLGLFEAKPEVEYRPKVTVLHFLSARFSLIFFYLLLAAGAMIGTHWWEPAYFVALFFVALIPVRFVRDKIFYSRCRLRLYSDHIQFQRGIIRRHFHYIPFEQARSIRTLRYPGRRCGRLRVVPGSDRAVSLRYLEGIGAIHEKLDDLLHSFPMRPVRQPEELDVVPVSRRHPLARNQLLMLLFVALFGAAGLYGVAITGVTADYFAIEAHWGLLGAAIFFFFFAPQIYLRARRTTILVEEGRVRVIRGLIYRTNHSVLVNRIDQLVTQRGPLNTLLNNGQVHVLTVGSTLPELYLGPVADERELYREIEARVPGKNRTSG